jgi:hypothetical protein
MPILSIPERVTVCLLTSSGEPFLCADILIQVHLFARHKNDFHLGPYPTNAEGIATFTPQDMQANVDATYDSGLMDYPPVGECSSRVEIAVFPPDAISRALEARTKVWTSLLRGEEKLWKSIEELRNLYRRAENATRGISILSPTPIHDEWRDLGAQCEYVFIVEAAE